MAPAPADAARRTTFSQWCGKRITGLAFVAGRTESLDEPCRVTVAAGGLLRIADSHISGQQKLEIVLTGGASLELRRSILSGEYATVEGDSSGGGVLMVDSSITADITAGISTRGDITLVRSSISGRDASVYSGGGMVELEDSSLASRDGSWAVALRAVVMRWSSLAGMSNGVTVGEGGDIVVIGSTMSGNGNAIRGEAAPDSIVLVGNNFNAVYVPLEIRTPAPARFSASDNRPAVVAPWTPEELRDAESGPRAP